MTHRDQFRGVGALLASEVSLLPILFFPGAQLRGLAGQGGERLGFGDENLLLAPHCPEPARRQLQHRMAASPQGPTVWPGPAGQ